MNFITYKDATAESIRAIIQHARYSHDKHSRSKVLDGGSSQSGHEKLGECCHTDGTAIGTLRYDLAVLDTLAIATIL